VNLGRGGVGLRKLPWKVRHELLAKLGSDVRKLAVRMTHQHCRVEFEGPVHLGPGFRLHIPDQGTLVVGPGVDFRRRFYCEISGQGEVHIGGGTTFTSDAMIQCTTSIRIGDRCAFAQSAFIVDGSHDFRDHTRHWQQQADRHRPISIGPGVLVNAKCTVLNDIGERAVIGANSVVSRPVPAYCLAVGSPARVVEYFGPPDERPADLPV
jgi:acetyltransferase-like isoleucine patch superfamily enzyme